MSDGWHPKFLDYLSKEYQRMVEHYHKDPSFKEAVQASVGADHPTPQAVIAAQATQNANQIAQANPPPKQPWESYNATQLKEMDDRYNKIQGALMYRQQGAIPDPRVAQFKPVSDWLAARGGLSPDEATWFARYRMGKEGRDAPVGPREPYPTDDQKDSSRDAYLASSPTGRAKIDYETDEWGKRDKYESHFDSLTGNPPPQYGSLIIPTPPPPPPQVPQEPGTSVTLAPASQEQGQPQ